VQSATRTGFLEQNCYYRIQTENCNINGQFWLW